MELGAGAGGRGYLYPSVDAVKHRKKIIEVVDLRLLLSHLYMTQVLVSEGSGMLKLCTCFHTKGIFLTNTDCLEDFHVCGVTFAD